MPTLEAWAALDAAGKDEAFAALVERVGMADSGQIEKLREIIDTRAAARLGEDGQATLLSLINTIDPLGEAPGKE